MSKTNELDEAVSGLVRDLIAREALLGATLSKPRRGDPSRAAKVTVEPVVLAGELCYRWRRHAPTRTTDENLGADETERRLLHLIGGEFRQAHLHGADADHQVLAGGTAAKVLRRPPTRRPVPLEHDRRKRRLLEDGVAVPFLVELGVMARDGRVRSARYAKFRQVNPPAHCTVSRHCTQRLSAWLQSGVAAGQAGHPGGQPASPGGQ